MNKATLLIITLLFTTLSFGQKREKIKGSKNVLLAKKEVEAFKSVEVEDNIELYLVKGSEQSIEIEADDNLHEAIMTDINGDNLRIYTSKEISGAKKLVVKLTYTNSLNMVIAKHATMLYAITELDLENITVKNLDFSKSFLNVKSANFSLIMNDKTTAELNLKSDRANLELSKNAELKALIASQDVKLDMYQKTIAVIEGDAANAKLRIDNNAVFTGKKFTVKNMELLAESETKCSILATEGLTIGATGKSEVEIYGSPTKLGMTKLADTATIYKKE
jgi:Putative auto-transporter adhesin, head GIN domain